MSDPAALRALLERLEKAECGDRGLDARLWLHLGCDDGEVANGRTLAQAIEMFPDDDNGVARAFNVPPLTRSLDAAVALCSRVLPQGRWCVMDWGERDGKTVYAADIIGPVEDFDLGPTPALALCRALVRAKMEQAELRAKLAESGGE